MTQDAKEILANGKKTFDNEMAIRKINAEEENKKMKLILL